MNVKKANLIVWMKEKDIFKVVCFAIATLTIVAMWLMFEFKDFDSITAWSLNIWDLIFYKDLGLKDFILIQA